MTGSTSGQDEANSAMSLATRADQLAYLSRSGLLALVPQETRYLGLKLGQ